MNKKIIAFGLSFTLVLSLHAIQPGADSAVRQASKKALPHLETTAQAGRITAFSADNEAIPLVGAPIRRVFSHNSRGTVDTLDNGIDYNTNFVFYPGDIFIEVYQAPTGLNMWGVGVDISSWNADGFTPSLLVEVWRPGTGGYPYLSDGTTYPSTVLDGAGWVGYAHPTDNDTTHYPDVSSETGLVWNSFSDGTGTCDDDPEPANGQPLYGTKVLPGGLVDYTITNPDDGSTGLYWIDFSEEAEAAFVTDEYIMIVVTYLTTGAGDPADQDAGIVVKAGDATAIYPHVGLKYYDEDCGGTSGNHGWHIRHYNWRFAYAVELTGDRGPVFESIDKLPTTLSTSDRTFTTNVTDDNPSGGDAGVAAVTLSYQLDSLTAPILTASLTMTSGTVEDGIWEGTIPGQDIGTWVYWDLTATDVGGLSTESAPFSYTIFEAHVGYDLIFDNQDPLYGNIAYAPYLYFYGYSTFDTWSALYGGIVDELTGHYDKIVELGSDYNNDAEIAAWWDGDKTYIVSGDEWLGARSGWTDGPTADGSVAKAILGIAYEYNDINYGAAGDQSGVSRLMAGTDGAASSLAGFLSDSLYLNYNPDYETSRSNWLDGVDAVDGYTVDMTGYSLVLDSATQVTAPTGSEVFDVMIHGQQGNGGKSAFLAFDVMALNTIPSYYWIGASGYMSANGYVNPADASPLVAVFELLDAITSVEDGVTTPDAFSLKGNYPNPFNPSTNITFNLNVRSDVTVTVYSLLGEEVATIHNSAMQPGLQSVKWNGTDSQGLQVASGVYIYRVEAQNRALTGKMMLLK